MHLSDEIIERLVEEAREGNKEYSFVRDAGYAKACYRKLNKEYPKTVMVKYEDMYFIAYTEKGKQIVKERLQEKLEKLEKYVTAVKKLKQEIKKL